MAQRPGGGWMDPEQGTALACAAGLAIVPGRGGPTGAAPRLLVRVTTDGLGGPELTVGPSGTDVGPGCERCGLPTGGGDPDEMLDDILDAVGAGGVRSAVREVVARTGRLAATTPELVEAEISLVLEPTGGVTAVGARIRLAPATLDDLWPRRLPS